MMKIEELYKIFKNHPAISTDTRNIKDNSIFFALKGANFNGNTFASTALGLGAAYVVIDERVDAQDDRYILVDDVLQTLQHLATYHRQQLNIPVIGITGTNGKTTSKELLFAVLSQQFKAFATQGNLNNHIGVPLSILSIDDSYEIAIIEMGANHVGEIGILSSISQPGYGLITNVGKAHLEGFGSFEGVKTAKGELYDYLQDHQGVLFLQADNDYLKEMAAKRTFEHIYKYGFSQQDYFVKGELVTADPFLTISWHNPFEDQDYVVKTHLTGSYNTENFLAAIAVGLYFKLDSDKINAGIAGYIPQNNRSQITITTRNTVVADFYNANASSMAAALDNMKVLTAENKVVVLGDMFELGSESYPEHANVVNKACQLALTKLIFVGEEFYKHKREGVDFYKTTEEAKAVVQNLANSFVLLKASRGMAFEKLLALL